MRGQRSRRSRIPQASGDSPIQKMAAEKSPIAHSDRMTPSPVSGVPRDGVNSVAGGLTPTALCREPNNKPTTNKPTNQEPMGIV